ncbi:MAG: DinB family protein, partial [Gemmatimonadetes bacterium]|nr:DinB family protein [Gemmatimonadota bacterium]
MAQSQTGRAGVRGEWAEYVRQAELQKREVTELVAPLSEARLHWRTAPNKWSVGEHLNHLPKTIRPYLATIDAAVEQARARGWSGSGPYARGGRIAEWFVRSMEPPVQTRMKTLKRLVPQAREPRERLVADFSAAQDELIACANRAAGVDLGRATLRSPYLWLLKLTVDQAFRVMLAHNRRHIWHIRQ